ncbi:MULTISPECIES: hypothetical protein [Exiguobacterium]|uniref:hypothetical protein n=1 Tax=Exiguobacterium sp. UBA1053 TaxID=1946487 RepID=UPI0025C50CB2|nr:MULTISPECIES: hypothetical protein [Exiguobacterium]
MSTISEINLLNEFFSDNSHLNYDDEPFRIYSDLHDKDQNGKEIIIRNVPHFTYTEGDLDESFIPYDVERTLISFLTEFKSDKILHTTGENDKFMIEYNAVEAYCNR